MQIVDFPKPWRLFPYYSWWKKSWKRFSENRRLVVGTEIDFVEVE